MKKLKNIRIKNLGKKELRESDFYYECYLRQIKVYEFPMKLNGITSWQNELTIISINSELRGIDRIKTMWHEMAHVLLHRNRAIGVEFCEISDVCSAKEKEAENFALCCIIPLAWVKTRTLRELVEDECFDLKLVNERLELYEKYKI